MSSVKPSSHGGGPPPAPTAPSSQAAHDGGKGAVVARHVARATPGTVEASVAPRR